MVHFRAMASVSVAVLLPLPRPDVISRGDSAAFLAEPEFSPWPLSSAPQSEAASGVCGQDGLSLRDRSGSLGF